MTRYLLSLLVSLLISISVAQAGIFDLPIYVEKGGWTAGIEPEIAISNGTGVGFNFKPRYAATDLLEYQAIIGTGSGARKVRVGGIADFEWFPDFENQPGIGTAFFMEYYRIEDDGLFSVGAKPMIYKTFQGQDAEYTPFFGVPTGWNLRDSKAKHFIQFTIGCGFKAPTIDHWRFTIETGVNAKNSYSYISGGVTYFP